MHVNLLSSNRYLLKKNIGDNIQRPLIAHGKIFVVTTNIFINHLIII